MRDFFRGWKRKVGVATLIVACVFAVGWVRSGWKADSIWCHATESDYFVDSLHGVIRFYKTTPPPGTPRLQWRRWTLDSEDARSPSHIKSDERGNALPFDPWEKLEATVLYDWIAFAVGTGSVKNTANRVELIVVRYWFVSIASTLITCVLLFSKTRPQKPQMPV